MPDRQTNLSVQGLGHAATRETKLCTSDGPSLIGMAWQPAPEPDELPCPHLVAPWDASTLFPSENPR